MKDDRIMYYEAYKDGKPFARFLSLEAAKKECKLAADNDVEIRKYKDYYPYLKEKYNVEKISDIPAEIRYPFWDQKRKERLKEHYYIKVVKDERPDEEILRRREEFHQKCEEMRKKSQNKKKKK